MAARQPRQAVAREALRGVPNGALVVVGDRVTIRGLVTGKAERVQREGILIRSRPALLDQTSEDPLLGSAQLGDVHAARIDACSRPTKLAELRCRSRARSNRIT